MKIFFQIFLYLNVSIGSLFFVIWVFTSFPLFQPVALAEEPAPGAVVTSPPDTAPAVPGPASPGEGAVSSASESEDPAPVPSAVSGPAEPPPAKPAESPAKPATLPAGEAVSSASESDPAPVPSAVSGPAEPPPAKPAESTAGAVPAPAGPPSIGVLAPGSEEPSAESAGVEQQVPSALARPPASLSAGEDEAGALPPAVSRETASAEKKGAPGVDSSKISSLQGGTGADTANELMDINKRIVELHKMLSSYNYDSQNRRNPFKPFQVEPEIDPTDIDSPPPEHPVYNYPTGRYHLSEIHLVGIKWNSKVGPSTALFKTPDNKLHQLQRNDRIGNNGSVVYQLKEDEVVVLEPLVMTGNASSFESHVIRLDRGSGGKGKGNNMDQHQGDSPAQQHSDESSEEVENNEVNTAPLPAEGEDMSGEHSKYVPVAGVCNDPDDIDSAGRRCGKRASSVRPGGA